MKAYLASTVLVLGITACGGSPLDPGAGDDPGTGTSTLTVNGSVRAQSRLSNAQGPGDFDTEFSVHVSLNNQPVTTGTVTMTSATGKVVLTYNGNGNNNNGNWNGTGAVYDEVYILDVVSGADNVLGVRVDGPDIHTYLAPTAGANVDSTLALDVKWAAGQTADSASIRTDQLDAISITDTGAYQLAPLSLKSEKTQAHTNSIRLTRTNRVTPHGAAGGSELAVSIENDIDVVALPNPGA